MPGAWWMIPSSLKTIRDTVSESRIGKTKAVSSLEISLVHRTLFYGMLNGQSSSRFIRKRESHVWCLLTHQKTALHQGKKKEVPVELETPFL